MTISLEIVFVLGLMLLNGALAMSELAMMASRRGRLEQLARNGQRGAAAALRLLDDPTGFLSTVQVGITLVGILAGAYSGATLGGHLGQALAAAGLSPTTADTIAIGSVVVLVTYLSLIVGELVPKRLALTDPERIACRVAAPMTLVARWGAPVVWVLRTSTNAVLRLLRVSASQASSITEDEIRAMVAEGAKAGVVKPAEHEMIEAVMHVADRSVRSIMTPRMEVVVLRVDDGPEKIRHTLANSDHSRFPLCRENLGDVVGVIHLRTLVDSLLSGGPLDLVALAQPLLSVSDRTPVIRLIELFRRHANGLAIVVDEYGVVEGIVTPADVLGAIAGGIDDVPSRDQTDAVRRKDGSWLVDGKMAIHRLERLLGRSDLTRTDAYATVAGYILWEMGRMPEVGDGFVRNGVRYEVVDLDGRRIDKVLIEPATESVGTS